MRNVRVSSVNFRRLSSYEQSLSQGVSYVQKAMLEKPDIVLLPEAFCSTVETAEKIPGPITDAFSSLARDNRCYIIVPQHERDGNRVYNSSALLDKSGTIAAVYRKVYPTDYEIASGVCPGQDIRAYETDFGRIGLATCFDMNFPELFNELAKDGVEALFFSSAYEGGRQLVSRALEHTMYVVSSHCEGLGYIIDKNGRVLDKSHPWRTPIISRTLNFDRYVFHLDYNSNYLDEITRFYGSKVQIDPDASEGIFTMESTDDDVSVLDIKKKWNLEFFNEYMDRSSKIRAAALEEHGEINHLLRGDRP